MAAAAPAVWRSADDNIKEMERAKAVKGAQGCFLDSVPSFWCSSRHQRQHPPADAISMIMPETLMIWGNPEEPNVIHISAHDVKIQSSMGVCYVRDACQSSLWIWEQVVLHPIPANVNHRDSC